MQPIGQPQTTATLLHLSSLSPSLPSSISLIPQSSTLHSSTIHTHTHTHTQQPHTSSLSDAVIIIRTDNLALARRRGYCDHFVAMCVCMWVYTLARQTKTPDRNDLKHGTIVVLDSLSIDSGLKGQGSWVTESASLCIFRLSPTQDEERLPLPVRLMT